MICPETLNLINTIANMVVAISASVALFTYVYNKRKDNILAVVDQVSFFREKVLSSGDLYINYVKAREKNYDFSRITLDIPDMKVITEKHSPEVQKQVDLLKKYGDELFLMQVNHLNIIEELSLRILYSKTLNHKAFNSVKPTFVQLVEMSAYILMHERDILAGNQIYSGTLDLYSKWKDSVDGRSPEERLQEFTKSYEKRT